MNCDSAGRLGWRPLSLQPGFGLLAVERQLQRLIEPGLYPVQLGDEVVVVVAELHRRDRR